MQNVILQVGTSHPLVATFDHGHLRPLSVTGEEAEILTPLCDLCGEFLTGIKLAPAVAGSPAMTEHDLPLWPGGLRLSLRAIGLQIDPSSDVTFLLALAFRQPDNTPSARAFRSLLCESARKALHDLAQPVQAVYSFTSSLCRAADQGNMSMPEKHSGWLTASLEQAERLIAMIKEQRSHYVTLGLQSIAFDPRPAVGLVLWELRERLRKTGLNLRIDLSAAPLTLFADPARLLAALVIYGLLLESAGQTPEQPLSLSCPSGAGRIKDGPVAHLMLPLPPETSTTSAQAAHYQGERPDLGMGYAALVRALQELGPTEPEHLPVHGERPRAIILSLPLRASTDPADSRASA